MQATTDALGAPGLEPALVGDVAAREGGVVEEPVGGEPLEGVADGLFVVLLGQEPAAKLLAAPGAVSQQAIGVAHDAIGGRGGTDLGDVLVRAARAP